jgi:hypothetical protein
MPTAQKPVFKLELDVLPPKRRAEGKESHGSIRREEVRNIIINAEVRPPGSPADGNITGPTNAGTQFKVDVDTGLPPWKGISLVLTDPPARILFQFQPVKMSPLIHK